MVRVGSRPCGSGGGGFRSSSSKAPSPTGSPPARDQSRRSIPQLDRCATSQFSHLRSNTGDSEKLEHETRHRLIPWVYVYRGEETLEMDNNLVVMEVGVPRKIISRYVKREIKERDSFLSLPFALLFVVTYCACFLNHDRALLIGDIEHAISVDLHENAVFAYTDPGWMAHKDLHDVHNIADVYSWLRVGLTPLLFRKTQAWSEIKANAPKWPKVEMSAHERRLYLNYNNVIGGLELTQLRAEVQPCRNEEMADALNLECIPHDEERLDMSLHVEPEPLDILMTKIEIDAYLVKFFLVGADPFKVDMRLRQLELSRWITNATVQVGAHYMSYNAHYDTLTLTGAMFFFSRSGKMWKEVLHSTFALHQWEDASQIFWDVLFVAMLLSLIFTEAKELMQAVHHGRLVGHSFWRTFKKYVDVWNVVDWISITTGTFLIVILFVHWSHLEAIRKEVIRVSNIERAVRSEFEERLVEVEVQHLYNIFRNAQHYFHYVRIVMCSFPLILVMRLLKSFNAQPRLALVTQTLARAGNDLLHFGFVFLSTFMSFTMMANTLFAHELQQFRTFWRSFLSCFEVLMGEFDFSEMNEAGRTLAHVWFICFQIMMVLIMLNMLLAIIMDVYTDVKGKARDTSSLQKQISTAWQTWRLVRSGKLLPLDKVYNVLHHGSRASIKVHSITQPPSPRSKGDETEDLFRNIFSVDDFMKAVPGLGQMQAIDIMENAVRSYRSENETPFGLSDAMRAISNIQKEVNRVFDIVQSDASPRASKHSHKSIARRCFTDSDVLSPEFSPGTKSAPCQEFQYGELGTRSLGEPQLPRPPIGEVQLFEERTDACHEQQAAALELDRIGSASSSVTLSQSVSLQERDGLGGIAQLLGAMEKRLQTRLDQQQEELQVVHQKLDRVISNMKDMSPGHRKNAPYHVTAISI